MAAGTRLSSCESGRPSLEMSLTNKTLDLDIFYFIKKASKPRHKKRQRLSINEEKRRPRNLGEEEPS